MCHRSLEPILRTEQKTEEEEVEVDREEPEKEPAVV